MDIKKAFNDFYDELEVVLNPHGFNILKNEQQAIKKIDTGFYEIFFNTNKMHDYTYAINLKFRIRCNVIQEVRSKITPEYADPESVTILSTTFKLLSILKRLDLDLEEGEGGIINFDNKISIEKWFSGFKKLMNEAVFAFFEGFKNVENFNQWFNKSISEKEFGFEKAVNWNSYFCGIIAAKLANNADYEKIYTVRMDDLIRVGNKQGIEELQRTKKYLDEHCK